MSSFNYSEYLKSEEWQRKRKLRLKVAGYCCEQCGIAAPLDIHHVTYENVGRETIDDLIALCRDCHDEKHTHPDHWQVKIAAMVGLIVKDRT